MLSGRIATGTQVSQLLLADKALQTIHTLARLCLTVCFLQIHCQGNTANRVPAAAPPQSYLPSLPVSPLFSIPPTFLLSLPESSQLSERGPPAGTGSAGPTHRLLSARLTPHTGCTSQVCSFPALCQPSHPGTTSRPGASRTSIAPPGCLHPHFCCGVISPWPQSLESWMLRQLGTPILFPQIYWTATAELTDCTVCKRADSSVRTEAKGGPPQNCPFSPEFSTSLGGIGPSCTHSKCPCVTCRFSVCLWSDGCPNKGLSITPTRRRLRCVSK